jgi:long-chain acyl-CoA synthetase
VVVTRDALPRTRLGKLRRHELPARFEQARAERQRGARRPRGPMTPDEMSDDDRALLDDRGAAAVWAWLVARHRDVRLTPDTSPALDLGVDSMGWLDLTLEVGRLTGVELDDATIAGIETVRDLLRAVSEREGSGDGGHLARLLERPEEALDGRQRRLLEAPGPLQAACARAAFGLNRLALRAAFRVRARDAGHVPPDGPCLLAPNHASYLDAFALASVLPTGRMERTHFAGWTGAAYRNPVTRLGSRLARVIPIERGRGAASSLALGAAVLARGDALVWFPEGTRSASGRLQRFQPGAGLLLAHLDVPVVPVAIVGAHEALPPGRRLPRLRPITVRFGEPVTPDALAREGEGDERHERILSALRARIEALLADG